MKLLRGPGWSLCRALSLVIDLQTGGYVSLNLLPPIGMF